MITCTYLFMYFVSAIKSLSVLLSRKNILVYICLNSNEDSLEGGYFEINKAGVDSL